MFLHLVISDITATGPSMQPIEGYPTTVYCTLTMGYPQTLTEVYWKKDNQSIGVYCSAIVQYLNVL